jgi:hypothetical protein
MQPMADRGRAASPGATDRAARAEALLREVIDVLDAGEFDCAAAYAEMARQALAKDALA